MKRGITQPSVPIPAIFTTIASLQKDHYSGRRTEDFCQQLPPGTVTLAEKQVRSAPLRFDGLQSTCYISGRLDAVVQFDDGSYGVIDFKTGDPSDDKTAIYSRQLQAYALALENPAPGAHSLGPVSRLGLLYFTPDVCRYVGNGRQEMSGPMTWIEIPKDDRAFRNFLKEVILLLDGPLPDPERQNCDWCQYRSKYERLANG